MNLSREEKTLAIKHRQINAPVSPFLQVNTLTHGGNRKVFEMKLSREEKTLAIKHRQINAPVSPFLQVNTLTQGGNRRVFEIN